MDDLVFLQFSSQELRSVGFSRAAGELASPFMTSDLEIELHIMQGVCQMGLRPFHAFRIVRK